MIDTKQKLFSIIDEVVEGLRAKAIVKDAIEDYLASKSKNENKSDYYIQVVINTEQTKTITTLSSKSQLTRNDFFIIIEELERKMLDYPIVSF